MTATLAPESRDALRPVRTLTVPVTGDFRASIYLWNQASRRFSLYADSRAHLSKDDLKRLCEAGVTTVYLDAAEYQRCQDHLRERLTTVLDDESRPVGERFGLLNDVVRHQLATAFRRGDLDQLADTSAEMAGHAAELISRDDFVLTEMSAVLYFDHGTFTHSANVAYYSMLLARVLGIRDRRTLEAMGTGGLLHDVGKIEIPEEILNKPARLSHEERAVIQRHTTLGMAALAPRGRLTRDQLMMVYQHHERLDGSGYPVRLQAGEIHDWSRICAVADTYEALTSDRPYRQRLSASKALEIMQRNAGRDLDPECLRCWQTIIEES
jgi:putative nucleotidyltransferase with HDIG domain